MWHRLAVIGWVILGLPAMALAIVLPERLEFNVYAFGIYAGRAVQEATIAGGRLQIVHTAVSADWMKWIYKVDDRIVSLVTTSPHDQVGVPVKFTEKIYEGRPRYDKEVDFDFRTMKATVRDNKEKRTTLHDVTARTYDSLSSFYAVRDTPLTIGKSIYIDVFDGKKLHATEVQVLRRERIRVKAGEFNTLVIKPIMRTKGIFEKTGDVFIWLSDDQRRLPVKMSSAAKIGAVTAELATYR
jgi:hypothetical protein